MSKWVKLNVGGQIFLTTKDTLRSIQGSFLARLVEDSNLVSDKVTSDPRYFNIILNYLRHGKLIVDQNLTIEGVKEEADFYNLPALLELIDNEISAQKVLKDPPSSPIYRAIKCYRDELSQLTYIQSGEYMCILSERRQNDLGISDEIFSEKVKLLQHVGSRS